MIRKILAAHKKVIGAFCFKGTRAQWVQCFLKIMFSLCSLRWLKPTRRRVNNFKPETSLVPKVLFAVGRIKSKSALRNTEYEGAWQIEVSSLFHSLIV